MNILSDEWMQNVVMDTRGLLKDCTIKDKYRFSNIRWQGTHGDPWFDKCFKHDDNVIGVIRFDVNKSIALNIKVGRLWDGYQIDASITGESSSTWNMELPLDMEWIRDSDTEEAVVRRLCSMIEGMSTFLGV